MFFIREKKKINTTDLPRTNKNKTVSRVGHNRLYIYTHTPITTEFYNAGVYDFNIIVGRSGGWGGMEDG